MPTSSVSKADRLRDLASQAEQLAALATLADAQLVRAGQDLATLAQAARRLALALECEGDTAEVNDAIGGAR